MKNLRNILLVSTLTLSFAATTVAQAQESTVDVDAAQEMQVFTLKVKTATTELSTQVEAVSADVAEGKFRNYVNENGFGDLEWDYNPETLTFTAVEPGQVIEEEELPVYTLIVETPTTNFTTTYAAEDPATAEGYFRNYVNQNGLGDLVWGYDEDTLTFTATAEEEEEEAELPVYTLIVETPTTNITTTYAAEDPATAEGYFRNYVNENGLGDLVWGYDADTLTFTATAGEEDEEEEVETPIFKLIVTTPTTNIYTEYAAEDAETAELYFRNYVNENGLGDLVWAYDADTLTFTATAGEEDPVQENSLHIKLDDELAPAGYIVHGEGYNFIVREDGTVSDEIFELLGAGEFYMQLLDLEGNVVDDAYLLIPSNFGRLTLHFWSDDEPEIPGEDDKPEEKPEDDKKPEDAQLPETGEADAYAIFGTAALAILAGVGLVAPSLKKEEE